MARESKIADVETVSAIPLHASVTVTAICGWCAPLLARDPGADDPGEGRVSTSIVDASRTA
jgi:hypothetical protein